MRRKEPPTPKEIADFRRWIRENCPGVKVSIRSVDFADLARASAKCLRFLTPPGQYQGVVNERGESIGIVADDSIY